MAKPLRIQFDQGYVSSRDETELQAGELVSGVGGYYKPGDPTRIWKEPGRSLYHAFSGTTALKGLALCQFDLDYDAVQLSGQDVRDRLFTFVDDRIDWVDPVDAELSGTFVSGVGTSGVQDDTQRLYHVHYNDIWYLGAGIGRPWVFDEDEAHRTFVRKMGMLAPDQQPWVRLGQAATLGGSLIPTDVSDAIYWWHWGMNRSSGKYRFKRVRHTVASKNYIQPFDSPENAIDGKFDTFAYARVGETPNESVYGAMEVGGRGWKADSLVRVIDFKSFPTHVFDGEDDRIEIVVQIVAGANDPSVGDVGYGDGISPINALVRIEMIYDDTEEYPVPFYWFDKTDGRHLPTVSDGSWIAVENFTPNRLKGNSYQFIVATSDSEVRPAYIFTPPAGLDAANFRCQISIAPWGAHHTAGMAKHVDNNSYWQFDSYPDTNINQIPTPSKRAMGAGVMRVYDIRIVDGTNSLLATGEENQDLDTCRWCYTEADESKTPRRESAPSPQSSGLTFTDFTEAVIAISGSPRNPSTTNYRLYRSNLLGQDLGANEADNLANFGFVKTISLHPSGYAPEVSGMSSETRDSFYPIRIQDIGSPTVATVDVVQDDTAIISSPRDIAPPALKAMTVFKGSIVGTVKGNPRMLAYSYAGYPEAWPNANIIDNFPLKENDILVAPVALDNVIIILGRNVVMSTQELPHVRLGRLVAANIDVIEGAPGCVGDYAYTDLEVGGYPAVAYVSLYGVYICDGHSSVRISEDLDWEAETNESTLFKSSLVFDRKLKHLVFLYDSTGDGVNDKKFIFHMDAIHKKQNNQAKITGPTPAKLTKMVAAQIGNDYRVFSVGSDDQNLYREQDGTADASNSWSGGINIVPFNLMTGRIYGDWEYWSAIRGNLRHTNWGAETMTASWRSSRDDASASVDTTSKTIALAGVRGTEFFIGRLGEWHQVGLTHITSGIVGGLHHLKVKAQPHGSDAGDV